MLYIYMSSCYIYIYIDIYIEIDRYMIKKDFISK